MNFEVAPEFEKSLKRLNKKYPSLKTDYMAFLLELEKNVQTAFIEQILQTMLAK